MRAGAKDRRIRLQALTQGKDTVGGNVRSWVDVAKLWAGVRHFSGDEARVTKYGGEQPTARSEFLIWHRAGVSASMRVIYDSQVYNIRHVNDVRGQRQEMLLTCDLDEGAAS
jgi:SPP1 family predicted phage head-tail adaptor